MLYCDWPEVHRLIDIVCRKINKDGGYFDCVLGVVSGGLIPAVLIKNELDISKMYTFGTYGYINNVRQDEQVIYQKPIVSHMSKDNILIVDEISDTGRTLKIITEWCKSKDLRFKTVTLHARTTTSYMPDYIGEIIKDWVDYVWEKKK